jgi:4-diphosphocytidyl-2-C-methyl-D-erythritol kinase
MPLQRLYDVPAPAKLNLFLHLVGKRPDGYHLLQSVFALLDWQDTLHFDLRHDGQLSREDLTTPLPEDDLCLRAARTLQSASGTHHGAHIGIHKQLPSGAGLGGGSSDAATTLLALNRLWGLNWPRQQLQKLALSLGADVPFFVGGHNAWVEGIGEHLTPISLKSQRFVVIKPPTGAQTHHVFSSPLLAIRSDPATIKDFLAQQSKQSIQQSTVNWAENDLQAAAESVCPDISKASQQLLSRFGHAHMTGSGSAVFARLGKEHNCSTPAVNIWIKSLPAGWVGRVCISQSTHPLLGWASD